MAQDGAGGGKYGSLETVPHMRGRGSPDVLCERSSRVDIDTRQICRAAVHLAGEGFPAHLHHVMPGLGLVSTSRSRYAGKIELGEFRALRSCLQRPG